MNPYNLYNINICICMFELSTIIYTIAEGCPDYLPPKYSWIQHENDTIVIQCEHSDNSWKMKCVDNIWLGVVGECATRMLPELLLMLK